MKRKKRLGNLKRGLLALALLSTMTFGACKLLAPKPEAGGGKWLSNLFQQTGGQPEKDAFYSPYAILIQLSDESILFDKNSSKTIYPASMTKMMTVLAALEGLSDLDERIVLPQAMFQRLYAQDAALAGFLPGESVSVRDLLYGAMLPSGAECCVALARYLSGSEAEFAAQMNRKAAELGMGQTHFVNSTGLHDSNHVTTVADLSILLRSALKNSAFREIFTAQRYSTQPTNLHPDGITFISTLFQDAEGAALPGGRLLGGKTGYTSQAGLCLASLAVKEGEEYIFISAGAAGNHQTEQYNLLDAFAAYNGVRPS